MGHDGAAVVVHRLVAERAPHALKGAAVGVEDGDAMIT